MQNNTMIPYNPKKDLETNYYNKTEVELLIAGGSGGSIDLSNYYKKLETYSKAQVDALVASGGADLSDYYTKAQVESLISAIPETDLSNYYDKTEVDSLIPDISTKQDTLVSATNIKTINGESILGSGDLVISGGGNVDLSDYYKKTETYSKIEVDTKIDDIPATDLSDYYNKVEVDTKIAEIPSTDLTNYYDKSEIDNLIGGASEADLTNYYTKEDTDGLLDTKQDTLISGTSIKTINGQSVLGNGNIFVTAEVDLSNYYTKPQVNEFINDINAELGSMVILGEYGLRWNQETDVYEALGSVNRRQIQGNMKRCVLKDDGTVNYYLNPNNSALKENGTPAVLTGADGNVMVEVPKFWYKHTLVADTHEWWVSNTPLEGYSVYPWFLEGGVERPFRYYRAYTPTVVSGKLRSISGSTPTRSQTRATFRTQARANGIGWGLCSWNAVNAIQILFLTEYCTFNSQAVLGRGNDTGSDHGMTTGQSNSIGNASSGASNNDMWMSYRGIENWYADCWELVDGINVQNYKVFLNQNPATFADDVFTGDYVDSGVTIPPATKNFIKKISGNFLPTAVGGSSSTYITDSGWSDIGNRTVSFGSSAGNELSCGAFALSANSAASGSAASIGAGLSR